MTGDYRNDSYYTSDSAADSVASIADRLADRPLGRPLKILEPAVGEGSLLRGVLSRLQQHEILLDVVDIDEESLVVARRNIESWQHPNLTVRYIHGDFLNYDLAHYDLAVSNPPFGSTRGRTNEAASERLYLQFLRRLLANTEHLSILIPKYFLESPAASDVREAIEKRQLLRIHDLGQAAFPDVKIETIIVQLGPLHNRNMPIEVASVYTDSISQVTWDNLMFPTTGTWHIYADERFTQILNNTRFVEWQVYRDRRITKSMRQTSGQVPLLRGRGIGDGRVKEGWQPEYLTREDAGDAIANADKVTRLHGIAVPNLSYYPRACRLPAGWVADGSVAQLYLPQKMKATGDLVDLGWYASDTFFNFYRVARNYSVRSLNVDPVSAKFWIQPNPGWKYYKSGSAHSPRRLFDFDWSTE